MAIQHITEIEKPVTMQKAARLLEAHTETRNRTTGRFQPVMLWGKSGIGKTSIVNQLAARKNRRVIVFMLNLMDSCDFRLPLMDIATQKIVWCTPDELPNVIRDGEDCYLFLDEINQASVAVLNVAMRLVLEGQIGEYELPKGCRIIAAANYASEKAAVQKMPTPLRRRFAHIHCQEDVASFCTWAIANNIPPELIAFLRLFARHLHADLVGDQNAGPSPRSWIAAAEHIDSPADIRQDLIGNIVGQHYAAEFESFLGLYRTIGSLDDIISNPDSAFVPTERSLTYAVAAGLGHIANRNNFANVLRYAKRLPRESEMLIVFDATTRNPSLRDTQAYSSWHVANQDVTLQAA